jgi:hypothetical protein
MFTGHAYLSEECQREWKFLGMAVSPRFVGEPEGDGVAERFIRTLEENLLWVPHFATITGLVEDRPRGGIEGAWTPGTPAVE